MQDSRGQGPPADIGTFALTASVIVYRHVFSGVTYYTAARHGEQGWVLVTHGTDPAVVIEAAWTYLNGLGGGTLVTIGPGQTWTINSSIGSQGANITWLSDWGLCLIAKANLNNDVVYVTHENVTLHGLYVDGNENNQGAFSSHCIHFYNANYGTVEKCKAVSAKHYGIELGGTAGTGTCHSWVVDNYVYDCCWNGICIAFGHDVQVRGNDVSGCSDVGISTWDADQILIENNVVHENNKNEGFANTHWDIGTETDSTQVQIVGNRCYGSAKGISLSGTSGHVQYDMLVNANTVYNEDNGMIGSDYVTGLVTSSNVCKTLTNNLPMIISGSHCIDVLIVDNFLSGGYQGIQIQGAGGTIVKGNILDGMTQIAIAVEAVTQGLIIGNILRQCTNNHVIRLHDSLECAVDDNFICDIGANYAAVYIDASNQCMIRNNYIRAVTLATRYGIGTTGSCDDIQVIGNYIENVVEGVGVGDGDDWVICNNRFRGCTEAIDVNNAAVVRPMIMGNNWEGCTNDINIGAATNDRITANVDKAGAWYATGDSPA